MKQTAATDLSPLTELPLLDVLDIEGSQLSDIAPLAKMQSLKWLWLDCPQVADLSPLENLLKLTQLAVCHTAPPTMNPHTPDV